MVSLILTRWPTANHEASLAYAGKPTTFGPTLVQAKQFLTAIYLSGRTHSFSMRMSSRDLPISYAKNLKATGRLMDVGANLTIAIR